MIGGTDIIIPTSAGATALDCALRAIRKVWPNAIIDDAVTGERIGGYEAVAFAHLSEVFVASDAVVADQLVKLGPTPQTADAAVHLILTPVDLTVVAQDPEAQDTRRIVEAVRRSLQMDILNLFIKVAA